MNLRNRVNTVHVPQKKQRNIYTEMEEGRMWWFFARELRSGNQDALKRRPKLWRMYEGQEDTEKKMYGLESHFRKYMRKKIHLAEMFKEDMFLCLRFFKIRLNKRQREGLEKRFGCTIDCDVDGTFRSAHFQAGDDASFTLPTAEEEATILEDIEADDQNDDDDDEEDDPNYTNRHVPTPKVEPEEEEGEGQGSQTRKRRKTRRSDEDDGKAPSNARPSDQHHANSSGAEDSSSDDVAILWEKRRAEGGGGRGDGQQQEGGGGSQTSSGPEIELMEGGGEEGQNGEGGNEGDDQRGSRVAIFQLKGKSVDCVLEIRPEDDKMEKARDELAEGEVEDGLDRSVDYAADETDIAEENRRNSEVTTGHGSTLPGTSAPTTTQGGISIVERQAALASVKKAFINGVFDVFEGKMSASRFLDQAGEYREFGHGLNWMVSQEDNDERAHD